MQTDPLNPGGNNPLPMSHSSAARSLRVERKSFTFDLRENPRGKFLRITEEVGGRHDAIVVPLTGLEQFRDALDEMIRASKSTAGNP